MTYRNSRAIARRAAVGVALATTFFALPTTAGASHSRFENVSDIDPAMGLAGAFDATFHRTSADGSRAIFTTDERLVNGDFDDATDVYVRARGLTLRVSRGAVNGNGSLDATFAGASADGSRVFYQTAEQLVAADTDGSRDVYEEAGGTTNLVSTGAAGGNGASDAIFRGASADGSRVFFETVEQLVAADTDSATDVYQRSGGVTELVSAAGTGGNGAGDVFFAGASADGSRVYLETEARLAGADTDGSTDVYERSAGSTKLVSAGVTGGNGAFNAFLDGASANGARVFFRTNEPLVGTDTDVAQDVYERVGGNTNLVSVGGNGPFGASFQRASANGGRVIFQTNERLVAGDTDSSTDVYERSGGATTLVSTGLNGNGAFSATFVGASADGTRVFFRTNERLAGQDNDPGARDIYRRFGGSTSLLSDGGNGLFNADFRAASADGTRIYFVTAEALVPHDRDARLDVYEVDAAQVDDVTKVSPGNGAFDANVQGASTNGSAVFLSTREAMIASDEDTAADIYGAFRVP